MQRNDYKVVGPNANKKARRYTIFYHLSILGGGKYRVALVELQQWLRANGFGAYFLDRKISFPDNPNELIGAVKQNIPYHGLLIILDFINTGYKERGLPEINIQDLFTTDQEIFLPSTHELE